MTCGVGASGKVPLLFLPPVCIERVYAGFATLPQPLVQSAHSNIYFLSLSLQHIPEIGIDPKLMYDVHQMLCIAIHP